MADTKPNDTKQAEAEGKQPTKKPVDAAAPNATKPAYATQRFWVPIIAISAGVILLCLAFAAGHRTAMYDCERGYHKSGMTMGGMRDGGYSMHRGGMMDDNRDVSNTRVSGVVTAVSGDTLTVAGNGTTTKVTTSNNTTYMGSNEPAQVNDTIVAFGAKDASGELVASSIRLVRQ